jgi:hypothetical protein
MLCVLFNPAHKTLIIKHSIQDCDDCDSAEKVLIKKTEKVSAEISAPVGGSTRCFVTILLDRVRQSLSF